MTELFTIVNKKKLFFLKFIKLVQLGVADFYNKPPNLSTIKYIFLINSKV